MAKIISPVMSYDEVLHANWENLKDIKNSIEAVESMLKQPARFTREEILSCVTTFVDNMQRDVLDAEAEYVAF